MAYTDAGIFEYVMVESADGTVGDKGVPYTPGYQPVVVRGFAVVTKAVMSCAGLVALDKRATAGSDTGRTELDTVAISNATPVGSVVFVDGLNTKVSPGEELVAEVTDATGTASSLKVIAILEWSPESPANNSDMSESA
jgi:hypothetical protein